MGYISHADCKGLEPRVMADITECRKLLEIFNDPARAGRIYEIMGPTFLRREVKKYEVVGGKKVKTKDYSIVKEVVLAVNYNAQPFTLQRNLYVNAGLEVEVDNCRQWINDYLAEVPEVKDYIWDRRREVLRAQEVVCRTGFVRHIPHDGLGDYRGSTDEREKAKAFKHAWNQAANVDIQHTASMIAKLWSNFIERARRREGLAARDLHAKYCVYMGPVHDSVSHDNRTLKIAKRMATLYREELRRIEGRPMEVLRGRRLLCPLDVDVRIGPSWAEED